MVIPGVWIGFGLFLLGASFAFFLASPIALKFFYNFQVERFSNVDPAATALAKPIAELPLLGVDGKTYLPLRDESQIKAKDVETAEANKPTGTDSFARIKGTGSLVYVGTFCHSKGC